MVAILITAGPTREYLDDVRFLSNGSSGRMGLALAEAARAMGHRAVLVLGPVEVVPPPGVEVHRVVSALEMQGTAERLFPACQIAIAAAAVADYRPALRAPGKPPKSRAPASLDLVPNPDIVAGLAAHKGDRIVVGFALEAAAAGMSAAIARGHEKLRQKQLDLVVVNLASAIGSDLSDAVLCFADGRTEPLPRQDKTLTAGAIVRAALDLYDRRRAA